MKAAPQAPPRQALRALSAQFRLIDSAHRHYGASKRLTAAATTLSSIATYSAIRSVSWPAAKGFRDVREGIPPLYSFNRSRRNPASVRHGPPGHHLPVKYPSGCTSRSHLVRRRKIKAALKAGAALANVHRLPLLDDRIPKFIEPIRNGVAVQFSQCRVPPGLPFLLGGKLLFRWWSAHVTDRPCSKKLRTAVFARLSLGAFVKSSIACRTDSSTSSALLIRRWAGTVLDTLVPLSPMEICRYQL